MSLIRMLLPVVVALAVVGGLAFSQLITLYVTPVFYTYLDELGRRFRRRAPELQEVAVEPGAERTPAFARAVGSGLEP